MSTENRAIFTPNLVVGVGIALLGIVLLLDQLQIVEAQAFLPYWPVLLVLFGASVAAHALHAGSDAGIGSGRQRPIVTPGMVLLVVIVSVLFSRAQQRRAGAEADASGETTSVFGVMSQDFRTSSSTEFRGADVTSVMGKSRLDLREAVIRPGEEATIDVFTLMGESEILVPDGWTVDVRATRVMGGVRDRRPSKNRVAADSKQDPPDAIEGTLPTGTAAPPRVIVRGFVMWGALVIRS